MKKIIINDLENFNIVCTSRELHDKVIEIFKYPETSIFPDIESDFIYEENHLLHIRNGKYTGYSRFNHIDPAYKIFLDEAFLKVFSGFTSSKSEQLNSDDVLLLL